MILIRLLAVLISLSPACMAAVITASSASRADVVAAIESASDGDTVRVPAGTVEWASVITMPTDKTLIVRGAGIDQTVITCTGSAFALGYRPHKIIGFSFNLSTTGISANGVGWVVGDCSFASATFLDGVLASGNSDGEHADTHPSGLVYGCEFTNMRVLIQGDANLLAHELWSIDHALGTTNAVVVEDCTFMFSVFANAVDVNYGGSYVFRHNTVTDAYLESHSVQGLHRASRSWEIYQNTIQQSERSIFTPIRMRGGTGVIWSNIFTGTFGNSDVVFDVVRATDDYGGQGLAQGGSDWDGNEAIETGTHNGSNNSATLSDSTITWDVNEWIATTASSNRWVWNITDGSRGRITANDATTVTATLSGGTDNDWDSGDEYKITGGYPARDQIGRGKDVALWTEEDPYPEQADDPAYIWGNTINGEALSVTTYTHQHAFLIQENRDYYLSAKPSYTPLRYPHPLRGLTRRAAATTANVGTINGE